MEISETLLVRTAAEWREWLAQNHATKKEIWLIYYKKTSAKTGITYEESVEQALCFGWIDGAIKGIDNDTYAGRFTPRRAKSPWSESNRERVARLLRDGWMTEAGMAALPEELRGIDAGSRAITAHDSLLRIVGIGESRGPTDTSTNKHNYLADASSDLHNA
jgi:uncharacterized protein YdeI (YjbR/CyaY-like superfamily)